MCEVDNCFKNNLFLKCPPKIKKSNEVPDAKISKKSEMHEDEEQDTESDESSDSSVTLSQSEFVGLIHEQRRLSFKGNCEKS